MDLCHLKSSKNLFLFSFQAYHCSATPLKSSGKARNKKRAWRQRNRRPSKRTTYTGPPGKAEPGPAEMTEQQTRASLVASATGQWQAQNSFACFAVSSCREVSFPDQFFVLSQSFSNFHEPWPPKFIWQILDMSWHLDYAISRQSYLVKASARGPQGGVEGPVWETLS